MPPGVTEVEFTLTPTQAGTRLRLVHRALPPEQDEIHSVGWGHFLARLTRAAAGDDPGPGPGPGTPATGWPPQPNSGQRSPAHSYWCAHSRIAPVGCAALSAAPRQTRT